MLYVMNSSVVPNFGVYIYTPLTKEEAVKLLQEEGFVSAVGHEATAQFLSQLFNVDIPVNRVSVKMVGGDRAIVCRLRKRLEEGQVLHQIDEDMVELGLLVCVKEILQ